MKYFKIVGLCLVAAFALSAVAAGSASASTQTILFKEGGSKPNFSSIAGKGQLVTKFAAIKCESARNTGEARPGTDLLKNIKILFSGCFIKIKTEEIKCKSSGQPTGSIQTFPLLGELGQVKASPTLVGGVVLTAESGIAGNPNTLFAEFECGPTIKVKVRGREVGGVKGGIVGELAESLNKLLDKGTAALLSFKQKEEVQIPNSLTVLNTLHPELLLEAAVTGGGGFELAGLEQTGNTELFFLESVEFSCIG